MNTEPITPPTTIDTSGAKEHPDIFGGRGSGKVVIDDNDYFCRFKIRLPEGFGRNGEDYLFVSTDNTVNRANSHTYQFAFQPTDKSSDDGMPSYENIKNYLKEYLKK